MLELIKQHPGITSAEIAEKLGLKEPTEVSNALWKAIRSNRIVPERVLHNGRNQNAYYLFEQLPPDAAERIQQRTIEARDAPPITKAASARNSVFDIPGEAPRRKSAPNPASASKSSNAGSDGGFSCAVANDGSLILMRGGQIELSLSGIEATTLQNYLVKRAAASFFASMT